jgi:hypothetical protein
VVTISLLVSVAVAIAVTMAIVVTNRQAFLASGNDPAKSTALTYAQKANVMRLLKMTDDLDRVFRKKGDAKEFAKRMAEIEREALELDSSLPRGDAARDLTMNAIKAYQDAGLMWVSGQRSRDSEEVAAKILDAGMRKALVRKVVQGVMNDREQRLLREWQTGQQRI